LRADGGEVEVSVGVDECWEEGEAGERHDEVVRQRGIMGPEVKGGEMCDAVVVASDAEEEGGAGRLEASGVSHAIGLEKHVGGVEVGDERGEVDHVFHGGPGVSPIWFM
jgi:hypothetical protein